MTNEVPLPTPEEVSLDVLREEIAEGNNFWHSVAGESDEPIEVPLTTYISGSRKVIGTAKIFKQKIESTFRSIE